MSSIASWSGSYGMDKSLAVINEYKKNFNFTFSDFNAKVAKIIFNRVLNRWSKTLSKYENTGERPGKYEWQDFKKEALEHAVELETSGDKLYCSDEIIKQIYEQAIIIRISVASSCSWTKDYSVSNNNVNSYWRKEYSLTDEAVRKNLDIVKCYARKIEEFNKAYGHGDMAYKEILREALIKSSIIDLIKIKDFVFESGMSIDEAYRLCNPKIKKKGCYVATAVYGSYDCSQVWTLRRFRDYTLSKTWYGRAFIRTYYLVSPSFVQWFGKTVWFKVICKKLLDQMVDKLIDNGVKNTPYDDLNW